MPNLQKSKRARAQSRARGFSLSQMKGGRYQAKVELPPRDGKRRQTSRVFDTREQAELWGMETALALKTGTHLDRAPDSFASLSDEWLEERKSAGVREITRRGYVSKLHPVMEAFGERRVQEITRQEVKALVRSLDHLSVSSVRQTVYCIKSVFSLAVENEIIAASPAENLKPQGKPAQRREELQKR